MESEPYDYLLSFSRLIEAVNPKQDLNLNGNYFLLFGRGETGGRDLKLKLFSMQQWATEPQCWFS